MTFLHNCPVLVIAAQRSIRPRDTSKSGTSVARSKEAKYGDALLRVMMSGDMFRGVVIRDGRQGVVLEDDDEQRLWSRLRNEAGMLDPRYVGYDGAISRFCQFFPHGFADARYVAKEREYKLAAREKLLKAAPLNQVLAGKDFDVQGVAKAFRTNMLSTFEAARVSELLRGANGSKFVSAAALFADGNVAAGLRGMALAVERHGRASWPIVTYLPFLWQPATNMFLSPKRPSTLPIVSASFSQMIPRPSLSASAPIRAAAVPSSSATVWA